MLAISDLPPTSDGNMFNLPSLTHEVTRSTPLEMRGSWHLNRTVLPGSATWSNTSTS